MTSDERFRGDEEVANRGMTKIYDLSLTISDQMTVYPGDPGVRITLADSTTEGADYNVSEIQMGSHTGTHVDAPRHVTESGASVDQLPLDVLVGEAWVCHFDQTVRSIGAAELEAVRIPLSAKRVLLGTSNSDNWARREGEPFDQDYVALAPDGAQWLLKRGVRLIGIDYLSIGKSSDEGLTVHRSLLTHGVIVVEGLNLRSLPGGPCTLCCLPMKLGGVDGAPARVVALRE